MDGMGEAFPKVVVGLGNPGRQYAHTRHNAGFAVIDQLLGRLSAAAVRQVAAHQSQIWICPFAAGKVIHLVKPMTFMNRSGDAVSAVVADLQLEAAELLVVYDCLDLPLGRLRLRRNGGSGGHNGMNSIIAALQSSQMPRLRIGIGAAAADVVEHVLSQWQAHELPLVERVLATAADAVLASINTGVAAAMNTYNSWNGTTENDSAKETEH